MFEKDLHVLTLSTDDIPQVRNYERTAKKFGYNYTIIGRGETFKGWSWRTEKYIHHIKEWVPDGKLVLLTDANDVYFVRPAEELIQTFVACDRRVVIGGEAMAVTGPYAKHRARQKLENRMRRTLGEEYCSRRWTCHV